MRSFVRSKEQEPFFEWRITRQTFYWLLLSLLILALGVWVLVLNLQVQDIYNQIDANSSVQLDLKHANL